MFWRRRGREPDEQPRAELNGATGELAAVRIYTAGGVEDGWVAPEGQRLSDILNTEDMLSLSRVSGSSPPEDAWVALEVERLLLVSAPTHQGDRRSRLHRIRRPVVAETAHYRVSGMVHLIAGIDLDPYLARTRQRFLPLTEATVTSATDSSLRDEHETILLNVGHTGERLKLQVIE